MNTVRRGLNELHAYFLCRETADTQSTSCSLQNVHFFMRRNLVRGEEALPNTICMQSVINFTTVRSNGVSDIRDHWVRKDSLGVSPPFSGFCSIK